MEKLASLIIFCLIIGIIALTYHSIKNIKVNLLIKKIIDKIKNDSEYTSNTIKDLKMLCYNINNSDNNLIDKIIIPENYKIGDFTILLKYKINDYQLLFIILREEIDNIYYLGKIVSWFKWKNTDYFKFLLSYNITKLQYDIFAESFEDINDKISKSNIAKKIFEHLINI